MQYALFCGRIQRIGKLEEVGNVAGHSSTQNLDQKWLAEAVVTESSEAIVVTDPDGIIRLWNEGAARMFGFPASEALGASLDLIIPEKLRDRHWKGYRHSMATGTTKYGDTLLAVPATHQDGRRLSIEFSVALLRDEAGEIVGISAIMREVSERRATEKGLRTRISDLENSEKALRARVVELEKPGA
jgi:PAS domain S-box-containing protein